LGMSILRVPLPLSSATHCLSPSPLFTSKTALITGSSSGIGSAFAIELARRGVDTIVLLARNEEGMMRVKEEIEGLEGWEGKVVLKVVDLGDSVNRRRKVREVVEEVGGVDVIVNNAGYSQRGGFLDTGADVVRGITEVNYLAGVDVLDASVKGMISRGNGPVVVWVGSVQGILPLPGRAGYSGSKHAVKGFCGSLRAELDGVVRVVTVNPGYVNTNLSVNAVTAGGAKHGRKDKTTANGMDPGVMVRKVLDRVERGDDEIDVNWDSKTRIAVWLKFLWPKKYADFMVTRWKKEKKKEP